MSMGYVYDLFIRGLRCVCLTQALFLAVAYRKKINLKIIFKTLPKHLLILKYIMN